MLSPLEQDAAADQHLMRCLPITLLYACIHVCHDDDEISHSLGIIEYRKINSPRCMLHEFVSVVHHAGLCFSKVNLGQLSTVVNDNFLGCSSSLASIWFHSLYHVHTLCHRSKYNMLAIQPCSICSTQEELGTIRVWSSIGHTEDSWSSVLEHKVLIWELVSIDWLTPGSISSSEISTLAHEIWDNTMECGTLEVKRLSRTSSSLLSSAQAAEVLCRLWNDIGTKLHTWFVWLH